MLQTRNDLPERTRQSVASILQKRLYDAIDLMQQAKQAHWNVKGENFFSLHELFDKIHEEIETSADLLAERISQLGGKVEGTCIAVSKYTSLPIYSTEMTNSKEHLESFSKSLATFAKFLRLGIEQTSQLKDAGSADILTQISRSIDKSLWFVESNLPVIKIIKKEPIKSIKTAKTSQMERFSGH